MTTINDWPARRCTADACDNGNCPCPQACEIAEPRMTRRDFWTVAVLFALAWSVVCAVIVVAAS